VRGTSEESLVSRPSVSVVVCTRDRPELLDGCLAALAEQRYLRYDVIVVDNASKGDATRAVAASHGVRCIVEPRVGLDNARNLGLAAARGAVVAFTDDDARPAPEWLQRIAAAFAASPDVGAVTGDVVAYEPSTPAQRLFERDYRGMSKGALPLLHRSRARRHRYDLGRFGTGCNMAFRRSALEALDGFDPALDCGTLAGGGGDLDALQRVLESGASIAYVPDAVVRHVHRRTIRELRRQLFDNGRGYSGAMTAAFLRAPLRRRGRILAWWIAWLGWWFGRRVVLRLVRRHRLPLSLVLAELAGAIAGPLLYLVARRRSVPYRPPRGVGVGRRTTVAAAPVRTGPR